MELVLNTSVLLCGNYVLTFGTLIYIYVCLCRLYKGLVPLWGRQIPCKGKHFHIFMLLFVTILVICFVFYLLTERKFSFVGLWTLMFLIT